MKAYWIALRSTISKGGKCLAPAGPARPRRRSASGGLRRFWRAGGRTSQEFPVDGANFKSGVGLQGAAAHSSGHRAVRHPRARCHDAAVACHALPRRDSAPTGSQMGDNTQPVNDRSLGWAFRLGGGHNQLLGSARLQIFPLRPPGRRSSRSAGARLDPMGKNTPGAVLHAQPLADPGHYARCHDAIALRSLASLARLAHRRARDIVGRVGGRRRFDGGGSRGARLLSDLHRRRPLAPQESLGTNQHDRRRVSRPPNEN